MQTLMQMDLFTPLTLGSLKLPNRIIMAPMSRLRSDANGIIPGYMADYYAQRASAGMIITESIAVAPYGSGYPNLPGLYSPEQTAAWEHVTRSVHQRGGRIAAQLWHVGHARSDSEGEGREPGWAVAVGVQPHELSHDDIASMIKGFALGAAAALASGFDAVEIHAGNGFLLDRMLRPSTNRRTDDYGGSENSRYRLLLEILDAVQAEVPAGRVGVRLSPSATVDGKPDADAIAVFSGLLRALSAKELAYVHVTRTTTDDRRHGSGQGLSFAELRQHYSGVLIGAGAIGRGEGTDIVSRGDIDAAAFGRAFLANPDLPDRLWYGAPLNVPDPDTFYTPGPAGLTDYPMMTDPS